MSHEIAKALEVWTLQSLLNFSIILGWLALGLSVVHRYYSSLKNHLTLRVSIEIWDLVTTILVDILLVIVVLVGFFILNPDIMAGHQGRCSIRTRGDDHLRRGPDHPPLSRRAQDSEPWIQALPMAHVRGQRDKRDRIFVHHGGSKRRIPRQSPQRILDIRQNAPEIDSRF